MTQGELLRELIKIHLRYSFERSADESSQFCTMWSMDDPPDTLTDAAPLEDICDMIDMDIEEEYAVDLFDMTLKEAADSLYIFMKSRTR